MRGYFKPPEIDSDDRDPLLEPDRTSLYCGLQFLLGIVVVGIGFLLIGLFFYFRYIASL